MGNIEEAFTSDEFTRYKRQFILKEIGLHGQKKLKNSRVLCIGAGGLGSSSLFYLAAAGIGTLGIVDGDSVSLSNLHRQILYTTQDVDSNKSSTALLRLQTLNPNVNIISYNEKLTKDNALTIIESYDIVIDGTDNFVAKYLINDACFILKKPNIYASIYRLEGQCSISFPGSPCYRCIYPNPPRKIIPNCAEAGVLGSLTGILGSIQATEAIKVILNIGKPLVGRLLLIDALSMEFDIYQLKRRAHCITCSNNTDSIVLQEERYHSNEIIEPGLSISVNELQLLQKRNRRVQLLDVRDLHEHRAYNIGGKLIPLKELNEKSRELNKAKRIIIYCQTGKRSRDAANQLRAIGFKSVVYLEGGILSWLEQTHTNIT